MSILCRPIGSSRTSHDSILPSLLPSGSPSTISSSLSEELSLRRFSTGSISSKPTSINGDGTLMRSREPILDNGQDHVDTHFPEEHVIHLSSIEHCMPRAYIRVCLAYKLEAGTDMDALVHRLNQFARKVIDAKPYLAGHVVPAPTSRSQPGLAEIRFTDHDFLNFPPVKLEYIADDDIPFTYEELSQRGLPPSLIRPDIVSALPEGTSDGYAPVFRLQANVVTGGLIVSTYLHHCISDGTGMGLIITGSVLHDDFTFNRHLESQGFDTSGLDTRLREFANQQTIVRQQLSWSNPNQIRDRHFHCHRPPLVLPERHHKPIGQGIVFAFCKTELATLRKELTAFITGKQHITANDVLQALLWHHMTAARSRSPTLVDSVDSRLFTPVNIRQKLKPPLPDHYFGAAVDFAVTHLTVSHLSTDINEIADDTLNSALDIPCSMYLSAMAQTALAIREAINRVDESYIRQAIALARDPDPNIDVRDLMGSSMNRTAGADMYITSWERLDLYNATLDLGQGRPDWVRKPWSKDPGSCIVMPNDDRKNVTEVLVQMTEDDMGRLMEDRRFGKFVVGWVE